MRPMNSYEEKIKQYIEENQIQAEHIQFNQSCHSVEEAAQAVNATPEDIVKSICLIDKEGKLYVTLIKGEDKVSTSRVAKALNIPRPHLAKPEEILEKTGYPCGGTPSFGYPAIFLMDPRVLEKEIVYIGGGSQKSVIKIATKELEKVSKATIVRVRK